MPFLASFPNAPDKIFGEPDFLSLKNLRDTIRYNAASVDCHLGGGTNGYLGALLTPAQYATVDPTAFVAPVFPGATPTYAIGDTDQEMRQKEADHAENLRKFNEYTNVMTALRKQILSSVDDNYLKARKRPLTGYATVPVTDLMTHLFDNYGKLTPQHLHDNDTKFKEKWDGTDITGFFATIDDCIELATIGNQPYTDSQILNTVYYTIFNTGLFNKHCRTWKDKPVAEQTYDNFKTFFTERAQELIEDQRSETQYGMALQEQFCQQINEQMANYVQQKDDTTTTLLQDLTTQIANLQKELANMKTNPTKKNRTDNGSYCWSHGYLVAKAHNSGNCKYPKPGHKSDATRENNMDGNQFGKPN